ncbi:MAG: NAD(P)H-binding protein [Gammaproteobacteria bacterium]|nr:NAD(P)H-binding protein [Gammaproteobacteria bacterium]MDH4314340.1 NAD(P)H-binding protein [Gammaproteobacteria bacterium]MDH5214520.1 NAD(P)H-binding protein [Gammaproteobacteria bacterium]
MRVAIIGGTGFVGSYLTDALLDAGHAVSLLVRPGGDNKLKRAKHVQTVPGDISDAESIRSLIEGCDALIYNVGILREVPREGITFEKTQYQGLVSTVEAAREVGVRRLLLMSANGVKIPGTRYQETKRRAEEYAFNSGLDVTVFRPSVIFGDPRGTMEFATQLFDEMVRPPIPAVNFFSSLGPNKGAVVMSPVHVEDVASAFVAALQKPECIGKTYRLGGPEVLTWKEMISRIAAATRRKKTILPMPIGLMHIGATLFDWLPFFPVTRDQLVMLKEGNVADPAELESLIERQPISFRAANLAYLGN